MWCAAIKLRRNDHVASAGKADRIAIWRRFRGDINASYATCAGAIANDCDCRLTKNRGHLRCHEPCDDVAEPAGDGGYNDTDGAVCDWSCSDSCREKRGTKERQQESETRQAFFCFGTLFSCVGCHDHEKRVVPQDADERTDMKIMRIEARIYRSLFTYGVGPGSGSGTGRPTGGNLAPRTMDTLLVKVETDQGVHGGGEGFGHTLVGTTRDGIDRLLAPACIGQDAGDIGAKNRML